MFNKSAHLYLFFCLCLLPVVPFAQEVDDQSSAPILKRKTPTYKVVYTDLKPLAYRDKSGNVAGLLAGLMKELCRRTNLNCVFEYLPAQRYNRYMLDGKADITITVLDNFANPHFVIGDEPIFEFEFGLYRLTDKPERKSLRSLRHVSLGVIGSFRYDGHLKTISDRQEIQIIDVDDHERALRMLLHGRLDYLLNYRRIIEAVVEPELLEHVSYSPIQSTALYLGLNTAIPSARNVLKLMSNNYRDMLDEGFIEKLLTKRILEKRDSAESPQIIEQ